MAVAWTEKIISKIIASQHIILLNALAVLCGKGFAYKKAAAKFSSCLAAIDAIGAHTRIKVNTEEPIEFRSGPKLKVLRSSWQG